MEKTSASPSPSTSHSSLPIPATSPLAEDAPQRLRADGLPSQAVAHSSSDTANNPIIGHPNDTSIDPGVTASEQLSRALLESSYSETKNMLDPEDRAQELNSLAERYYALYEESDMIEDMDKVISLREEVVDLTSLANPLLSKRRHHLGIALQLRFSKFGELADIGKAIQLHREAIAVTNDDNPDKPFMLSIIGNALLVRFQRTLDFSNLENAILFLQQAVGLTPNALPDPLGPFNTLGNALRIRFEFLGDLADIDNSISVQQRALNLTPEGHPDRPGHLGNVSAALLRRFERTQNLEDLDNAITGMRTAVELTPTANPDKPSQLTNLGSALMRRFELNGDLADISDAISKLQDAVALAAKGFPDKPGLFNNLGVALQVRFERLGDPADLDNSISALQLAIELTPEGHPNKLRGFNSLGGALSHRFERTGVLADINTAISNLRQAVDLTPEDQPDKLARLNNLGFALSLRFERLGSLKDLDDAITSLQRAVELTPEGHPDHPTRFSNLGSVLVRRFERAGSVVDIEEAVSVLQKAVVLTPDGQPNHPTRCNNLGAALWKRFERTGSIEDINNAVRTLQKAVDLTPDGHPGKAARFGNLAYALKLRFERLRNLVDLENSILFQQKAVDCTPEDHPDMPNRLHGLGRVLYRRFERFHARKDLEGALQLYSRAAKSATGPAMARFNAAREWANASSVNSLSTLPAFGCAIDLLPRIAWLGVAVTDQHALLSDVGGVVRDAVAAAIKDEKYETAVEWAEQGRSIVWQNMLGLRSPVDDLRTTHPHLADRLQNVSRQLEGPGSYDIALESAHAVPLEDVSHNYSQWALEREEIIEEIRQIPNFESFLKPKDFSKLSLAAYEGPVVILNAQEARCDALVIVSHDPDEKGVSVFNIPLERFSYEKGKRLFEKLNSLLLSAGVGSRGPRTTELEGSRDDDADVKFKVILHILWQDVVKPVLEGLAYQVQSTDPLRIWWCATGLFAFLPIHAAGSYDVEKAGEKLSDYAVSSYTPSLTTILDRSKPTIQEGFQLLTIAQPFAPGARAIPETEVEVDRVQRVARGLSVVNLTNQSATVARVRQEMEKSSWVHLACHGKQRTDESMKSGLLLYDGTLELSAIVKHSLPKADFAFLSACQTATGDEKVPEESVHLAAGMFLAGYKGVIATMWSINDDNAPQVAEDVYSMILKGGVPDGRRAAHALHEAVKNLRNSGVGFVSWVPFIHIGR